MSTLTRSSWGLDHHGEPWQDYAACSRSNPEIWTTPPKGNEVTRPTLIARARYAINVCLGCPVREDCDRDAQADRPIGVIRAGVPYTDYGIPMPSCTVCGVRIVCADPRAVFCEKHGRYDLVRLGRS